MEISIPLEVDSDGTLEIGFYVDRSEKDEFMAAFKAAKKAVQGK